MGKTFLRATTLAWIAASGTAAGQSLIQDENLVFALSKDFQVGYQSKHGDNTITEYVPIGETVDAWSEMVTVQIYRHAAFNAVTFLQDVGNRYINACPDTAAPKGGTHTGTVNGYLVSMLILKCPRNPSTDKPETTIFRIIQGNDAVYLVQHAWRSVPSDAQARVVMAWFAKVIVCDTRDPKHACPSFDSLLPAQ